MDILEVKELWSKVKSELSVTVPEHVFDMWIKPLEAADYENKVLVLISPHLMSIDILKKSWTQQIKDAVQVACCSVVSSELFHDVISILFDSLEWTVYNVCCPLPFGCG